MTMDNLPLYIDKKLNLNPPHSLILDSYINFEEVNNLNKTILVWADDNWHLFDTKKSFLYKKIKDNKIYVDFGENYRGKYVANAIQIINE